MGTKPRKYIWVNKKYFNTGLKPLDILILSKIEEENTHGRLCSMTNEEFAAMFGETAYAVKQSLSRLEHADMITKDVHYVSGNGRGNRRRDLKVSALSKKTDANNKHTR